MNFAGKPLITGLATLLLALCGIAGPGAVPGGAPGNDGVPVQDLRAGGNERMRYFLIGVDPDGKAPKKGKEPGLVLVLPGGKGNADFLGFIKSIHSNVLSRRFLTAELVSVKWTPGQRTVWPTRTNRVEGQEFTTEEFVAGVVEDVRSRHPVDASRIFTLSWSSGGPAAYAVSLQEETPVRGAYVAQAVFTPRGLPLAAAAGHPFFLDQSPQDVKCPFWHAEKAQRVLGRLGAPTRLVSYEGGHGWQGDVFGRLRTGFDWLEKEAAKAGKGGSKGGRKRAKLKLKRGENLLFNGDFEKGLDGWTVANNTGRMTAESDGKVRKEGTKAIRIAKTGGPPFDLLRNDLFVLPPTKKVRISALYRAESAGRGMLKFFLYDGAGESINRNTDVYTITGSASKWKTVEKTFDLPAGAESAAVMFLMVEGGTIWLDGVAVTGEGGTRR